jgi:hypothetical protein
MEELPIMRNEDNAPSEEDLRAAARMLSSKKTPARKAASQENVKAATAARTGRPMSEEHKRKIAEAQRAHWAKVKTAHPKAGETPKKRGRPPGSKNKENAEAPADAAQIKPE